MSTILACERDPLMARRVNVQGPLMLARGLVAHGSHIVFLSTNQVLDGRTAHARADEPLRPHTAYGRSKAEAEEGLRALPIPLTIVRFGKILEPGHSLLAAWLADLEARRPIRPFLDLPLAPVPVRFAVEVLVAVIDRRPLGCIQVTADQDVTYLQVARHLARKIGAADELVQPAHSTEAGFPQMCVPLNTTLDTTRLRAELGLVPPDVWATINEVLGL